MKFLSCDSIEKIECETEIMSATSDTVRDFSATWEPYVDDKIIRQKDRDFNYRCFEWDRIIRMSLSSVFIDKCYAAYTGTRLDGLLSFRHERRLYLDFFATAPWNYYGTAGRLRRIVSGLVYFTIEICERESGYFEKNAERMRHAGFRKRGLFVGSGVLEAGCRTVVGQRLKQSGMHWTVRGANSIIALRCSIMSNRWEDFWEHRAAA